LNTAPAPDPEGPPSRRGGRKSGVGRALGLGLITGAADDDPSAIGTYASAGAQFGPGLLWMAPVTMPMMYVVVYLSSKLGQVSGRGLFHVIRDFYPRWLLWAVLIAVITGNTIEAAADLGGMAAAINLFAPLPIPWIAAGVAVAIFALQVFGSYVLIRDIFRWLALALLAYVGAAVLARPEPADILRGTFIPRISFDREFLAIVVAVIGTTLSAYIYTWQSNQEVEEEIALGRTKLRQRIGATDAELRRSRRDILIGMTFSNVVMYFIILSTGSTLHPAGQHDIESAAQAAEALRPLAGGGASVLFTLGIIAGCAGDDHRRSLRCRPDPRMEGEPACEGARGSEVLCGRGPVHRHRCGSELPGFQSDEGAGLVRCRPGILHPAPVVADHVDDQQPQHHGRARERLGHQHPRMEHDGGDLPGQPRARRHLVHLKA
jgi:Mn2+/Fe2+ NRAMP family transporter